MRPFLLAALAAALAFPAPAQVVPDEVPDSGEPFADRARREVTERHRPFLSGLYAESAFAVGPEVGGPALFGSALAEGGYRFDSGLALGAVVAARAPLGVTPLGEPDGASARLGVGLAVPVGGRSRRFEVGVGGGVLVSERATAFSVEVAPRVVLPLTPVLSVPVGLRVSQEVGGAVGRGPFVGVSLGLRRIWADDARMVLE